MPGFNVLSLWMCSLKNCKNTRPFVIGQHIIVVYCAIRVNGLRNNFFRFRGSRKHNGPKILYNPLTLLLMCSLRNTYTKDYWCDSRKITKSNISFYVLARVCFVFSSQIPTFAQHEFLNQCNRHDHLLYVISNADPLHERRQNLIYQKYEIIFYQPNIKNKSSATTKQTTILEL